MSDFLKGLLENASSMLGYGRGSVVRANEHGLDAKIVCQSRKIRSNKQDIDRELKRACEDLITLCATNASKPLRSFLDQCSTYLSRPGSTDLPSQPFATPEKIKEVHDTFKNSVKGQLERWTSDLMKYLQDAETVRVLVPPAQVSPELNCRNWLTCRTRS
jgi:hypothetical protein